MAEQEVVAARARAGKFNKNEARRLRMRGRIPGVIYGAREATVPLDLDPRQIARVLQSATGHNTIFDLEIAGAGPSITAKTKAMIVDWQYEPAKGALMHIDLKRIAMDKPIRVEVPIRITGVAIGVKTQGGVLDQVLREVELECLPADIPGHITVDVSNLSIGDGVRVADLEHGGKLKFLTDPNSTVAHVVSIKEEVEPAAEEVAATEAEAAPAEPEVVKKGKQETAEEPAPEAKPAAKPAGKPAKK